MTRLGKAHKTWKNQILNKTNRFRKAGVERRDINESIKKLQECIEGANIVLGTTKLSRTIIVEFNKTYRNGEGLKQGDGDTDEIHMRT